MKTTVTVKVLLVERFEKPKVWTLEVPREMEPERIADLVFYLSNAPNLTRPEEKAILADYPRTGLRSVSVGDIIIIGEKDSPNRHIATVEGFGFKFH